MKTSFGYLRDPLFLVCACVYLANRFLIRPAVHGGFFGCYLNDLICLPFWVPILVTVTRAAGWRTHDGPPRALEVLLPLLVVSALFELLLPNLPFFERFSFADPWDVVAYASGGLAAVAFWSVRYDATS